MKRTKKRPLIFLLVLCLSLSSAINSFALGSSKTPQSGALGLEATIPSTPPTSAPSISIPANGQSFTSIPITAGGLCASNLLVKVFSNNVFIGSAVCNGGSFSLRVSLFNGSNVIYAQDFDALGQGSPVSGKVTVNYSGGQFSQPGSQLTLTSSYGEMGANPGQQLDWPIVIGGGTLPYAISTDWGDGSSADLQSSAFSGTINIKHIYSVSGIYPVTITATDSKGSTAFLQVVGVANGQIAPVNKVGNNSPKATTKTTSTIPWWVFLLVFLALIPTFWLGNRHGRSVLMRKYE